MYDTKIENKHIHIQEQLTNTDTMTNIDVKSTFDTYISKVQAKPSNSYEHGPNTPSGNVKKHVTRTVSGR